MRSFWSEPFLWIHAAGLAALPIFLELCLLGLAVSEPLQPIILEFLILTVVGVVPVLWMQWSRPFYIFSILALAIKPDCLTVDQRKILGLFKNRESKVLSVLATLVLGGVLWQLYRFAPIAVGVVSVVPKVRVIGLIIAAAAFLASNLFLQVPLSVIRVLLTSEADFATAEPYAVEQIQQDFTIPGFKLKQILPAMTSEPPTS